MDRVVQDYVGPFVSWTGMDLDMVALFSCESMLLKVRFIQSNRMNRWNGYR